MSRRIAGTKFYRVVRLGKGNKPMDSEKHLVVPGTYRDPIAGESLHGQAETFCGMDTDPGPPYRQDSFGMVKGGFASAIQEDEKFILCPSCASGALALQL